MPPLLKKLPRTTAPDAIDRRRWLQHLLAATAALPASTAWAQYPSSHNPFTLGVASGSPTHQSVVLWTRLIDQGLLGSRLPERDIPVRWELARDAEFKRLVASGVANAVSALAHSVHVEVQELPPDQWFHYRFRVGDHLSRTGRTRTLADPAGAASTSLRLAYASCQHYEHGYFTAYPHLVADRPDLVLFLGDYIYEGAPRRSAVRSHDGSWCLSLSDYRSRYAQYKADPDLQEAHAACPWVVTWDDHEVQNDYAGLVPGTYGPETDFARRRAHAYQAYYEHMPLRAACLMEGLEGLGSGAELRLYRNVRHGSLVSLSMLDCRQYRSPQVCTPGSAFGSAYIVPELCPELADEARSLLGPQQERWLDAELHGSRAQTWTLIGQSTLFGPRRVISSGGPPQRVWNDGWDGYPAARRRLLDSVKRHATPNLVVLGGDVHEHWVGLIKEDYANPASATLGVEFCGTSLTSPNGGRSTEPRQRLNPHFLYAEGLRRGYGLMNITPEDLTVELRAVRSVESRRSDIETIASFRVRAGSRLIERQR